MTGHRAIREVTHSWEHPDWLAVLKNLRYILDHPEGPPDRTPDPTSSSRWPGNQSKAGADLIINISMRKLSPSYSIAMAFEDAFRTWEGRLIPHFSESRPINTSSVFLRPAIQGHTFQSTIHSPPWKDLVNRSRGRGLVSKKGLYNFHCDLLSMTISQVEPTLKPYDTYLPPLNSHRVQDAPLNNLDEVYDWMRLHRPAATDDRECGNSCAL